MGKNNSQAGLLVTAHNFQQRFPDIIFIIKAIKKSMQPSRAPSASPNLSLSRTCHLCCLLLLLLLWPDDLFTQIPLPLFFSRVLIAIFHIEGSKARQSLSNQGRDYSCCLLPLPPTLSTPPAPSAFPAPPAPSSSCSSCSSSYST